MEPDGGRFDSCATNDGRGLSVACTPSPLVFVALATLALACGGGFNSTPDIELRPERSVLNIHCGAADCLVSIANDGDAGTDFLDLRFSTLDGSFDAVGFECRDPL